MLGFSFLSALKEQRRQDITAKLPFCDCPYVFASPVYLLSCTKGAQPATITPTVFFYIISRIFPSVITRSSSLGELEFHVSSIPLKEILASVCVDLCPVLVSVRLKMFLSLFISIIF